MFISLWESILWINQKLFIELGSCKNPKNVITESRLKFFQMIKNIDLKSVKFETILLMERMMKVPKLNMIENFHLSTLRVSKIQKNFPINL